MSITEIKTIADISKLAINRFTDWSQLGCVYVREKGDLIIFNYTQAAAYEGNWNYFERVSRGLIMDLKTGEVVARPFDKFYNWMEGERKANGIILSITEKIDGSLGILYRINGEYKIATRGSFDSDQALWATDHLNMYYDLSGLQPDLTLLFEIIYPENRVVVDYGDWSGLILLAARNRISGEYLPFDHVEKLAEIYHFLLPDVYRFDSIEDIIWRLPQLDANQEGYVVEFSDGQRFKFKGDKYKELHRLISMLSFKNTLAAVASGTVDNIISQIPDEFLGQFKGWVDEINNKVNEIEQTTSLYFIDAPKDIRKDFAIWVMQNCKDLASYMFLLLDGRDIKPLIYKKAFEDCKNDTVVSEDAL
jgi:RNA ligase